jgi:ATP-dependent Clp protease ATP-binding subunit ClpA
MFERFTDRARRVLVIAQDEALALDHNFLGTEHVLLGLIREGEGVGAKALQQLGVDLGAVRQQVVDTIGRGTPGSASTAPAFTPRAKKVLELSLKEALGLGHNYIGTEHILLGLIREGEGVASQVLVASGLTPGQIRSKVIELLVGYTTAKPGGGTKAEASTPAVNVLATRVRAAAGDEPVGTHHHLLALLEDPNCLAARILESFGVTKEAVASRIAEMGTAGTTDELPQPKPIRAAVDLGPGLRLDVDDPALAGEVQAWVAEGLRADDVLERLRAKLQPPNDPPSPEA